MKYRYFINDFMINDSTYQLLQILWLLNIFRAKTVPSWLWSFPWFLYTEVMYLVTPISLAGFGPTLAPTSNWYQVLNRWEKTTHKCNQCEKSLSVKLSFFLCYTNNIDLSCSSNTAYNWRKASQNTVLRKRHLRCLWSSWIRSSKPVQLQKTTCDDFTFRYMSYLTWCLLKLLQDMV